MIKKISLILLLFFNISSVSLAKQEIQIEISTSKTNIEISDFFQVAISIKHASTNSINIQEANIPGIENFQKTGSSQSTQIQMTGGGTAAITESIYTLKPKKEGNFQIGPIKMVQNGNIIAESNVLSIEVAPETKKSFFSNKTEEVDKATPNQNNKSSNFFNGDMMMNILMAVLLIVMIVVLYKRSKSKDSLDQQESSEDFEEQSVSKKIDIPKIDDEKFYEKCKENILKFLEQKYNLELESLTTKEILTKVKKKNLHNYDKISKALEMCDNGRFAASDDMREELLDIINNIN